MLDAVVAVAVDARNVVCFEVAADLGALLAGVLRPGVLGHRVEDIRKEVAVLEAALELLFLPAAGRKLLVVRQTVALAGDFAREAVVLRFADRVRLVGRQVIGVLLEGPLRARVVLCSGVVIREHFLVCFRRFCVLEDALGEYLLGEVDRFARDVHLQVLRRSIFVVDIKLEIGILF